MLRFRRLVSGGAGNGPLLGALQPPQPSMGLKHHLCFSQRLLQSPQGKGLIIKKTQMGQPLAADLVKTELPGLLHFSGAAKLLQDWRDVHCMLFCVMVGKSPHSVCRDEGDPKGLFPFPGVSLTRGSHLGKERETVLPLALMLEPGSVTGDGAKSWVWPFWKEGLKIQNPN